MRIRLPSVAGLFYPYSKDLLEETVERLLNSVDVKKEFPIVVSPHAGYEYSGLTAAFALSSLKKSKTFIIIGPNHTGLGAEFSLDTNDVWETPMGRIKVNKNIVDRLLNECSVLEKDDLAHMREHSLEVQLPFIQFRFRTFDIVPVCVMNMDFSGEFMKKCMQVGGAIANIMKGGNASLIASSDFSHYLPADVAKKKDRKAVEKIKSMDIDGFFETLSRTNASICGFGPIAIAMAAAKRLGFKEVVEIHSSNSGDATGDYTSVVSYKAIGFR